MYLCVALSLLYSLSYIQKIEASAHMKPRDLHRLGDEYNSIYINSKSYHSARLAAGSTFNVVEAVVTGKAQNGICIVRPPGHHAEPGEACGFCFFNTVALAARYAQRLQSQSEDPLRVMILDWDVHHGNGTQHIFQEDASVLYMSLHRYDEGLFFPNSEDASHDKVGIGKGAGYNVNIPWNGGKMGDVEYLMAFHRVVMPIAYEFNPQLVLISAGFDAARGDPLGGCQVSPEGYAHMTHLLMSLAGGRVILVLEGGYNLTSISESMVMCTRSLLGDPPPVLSDLRPPKSSALNSVCKVRQAHRKYWRSLRLNVVGPPPKSTQGAKNLQHSPMRNSPRKGRFAAEAGPLTESKISTQGAPSPKKIPSEVTVTPLASPLSSVSIEETPIPLIPDSKFSPEEVANQFVSAETVVQLAAPQYKMSTEEVANKLASPQGLTSLESTSSQLVSNREAIAPAWEHETPKSPPTADSQKVPMGGLVAAEDIADALAERGLTMEILGCSEQRETVCKKESEAPVPPCSTVEERPLEQILRDLQLSDDASSSSTIAMAHTADLDPRDRAIRKSFISTGRDAPEEEYTEGSYIQVANAPPNEQELLDEAAGGSEAGNSTIGFEVFLNSMEDESDVGFAVMPLSWCPHLGSVCAVPRDGLDVSQPCAQCGSELENWLCLTCYQVLCGRYVSQHMLSHGLTSGHHLVLSFSDLSVWCYGCESYVHNEALFPAKSAAYSSKFEE
ncbi:hypothetical protein XELAEV_18038127mg [Xenopus laevis]|uniref:Protein deacetylase HDAC6 n=1 Tax=Xenopus laevis TaxID=8355 RepID=A0A974C680_XENLA|nr:hypothetical protein XELAEV_18038127mg [Xenopus laevis]